MKLTPNDEAAGITKTWELIDPMLGRGLRLRPGLKPAALSEVWNAPWRAWLSAHDGQQSGAAPFYGGWRLLGHAEGMRLRARLRGKAWRSDWEDSWRIVARGSKGRLLCYSTHSLNLFEVDVSRRRYTRKRIGLGLSVWLEAARSAMGGGAPAPRAGRRTIAPPPPAAPIDAVWRAIEAWVEANPDEQIVLSRKGVSGAALAAARRTCERPLRRELVALLRVRDGQPSTARGLFRGWMLLGARRATRIYAEQRRYAQNTGDRALWQDRWWPLTDSGAGDCEALDLVSGAVLLVSRAAEPRKIAPTLARWFARRARDLVRGQLDA
jgi:cell wall assembly regulator SMI1